MAKQQINVEINRPFMVRQTKRVAY